MKSCLDRNEEFMKLICFYEVTKNKFIGVPKIIRSVTYKWKLSGCNGHKQVFKTFAAF